MTAANGKRDSSFILMIPGRRLSLELRPLAVAHCPLHSDPSGVLIVTVWRTHSSSLVRPLTQRTEPSTAVNGLVECSSTTTVGTLELRLTNVSPAGSFSDPAHLPECDRCVWPCAMQRQQRCGTKSVEFWADSATQFLIAKEFDARLSFLTVRDRKRVGNLIKHRLK
jgi:hypothetical protein